ncbi:MAG: GTPase HflX [Clostridia bacterium]|nr:GTPase HflX [Clostridia bacterium]
MAELAELAKTAGAQVVASVLQPKEAPDVATYLGSGKLEELKFLCENNDANLVIFDDELTGSQQKNIEDALGVRVIDRSTLILDIFASRAMSKEGKLQVELAQLKYRLPRLTGMGLSLSRLGGGIGTRGPGETKLESDKRHIRTRISHLLEELKDVERRRGYARDRRKKDGVLTVSLVGYTNAGKSTLMNRLTDAGVLVENKLFATLDTTSRALKLPDDREVLLIDTVGFIRKLPHHLINAFKSTLEEAVFADVILNVMDFSNPEYRIHREVSEDILTSLGCSEIPKINVYNKCDLSETTYKPDEDNIYVSAVSGEGMEELLKLIAIKIPNPFKRMNLLIPYDKSGLASSARVDGKIISEEYLAEGIKITADIDGKAVHKYEQFGI